jgi:integrase/recombinase XerD
MRLSEAVERYVAMKRVMGFSFQWGAEQLQSFCRSVDDISVGSVVTSQVADFLEKSGLSERGWLYRHRVLKAFFEHWLARYEVTALPLPPSCRPRIAPRAVQFVYSVTELRQLLNATSQRRRATPREFSSLTFRMLLVFLYGTGARINETVALTQHNIDLKHGTITFHWPPRATGRTIPISPHLLRSLREYAHSFSSREHGRAFFCRRDGKPVRAVDLTVSFQKLRRQAGIVRSAGTLQPTIRDLRRTFAVHCMRVWLKEGKDVRAMLPLLGAYLGHVSLSSTEAYLAVTPERFRVQLSRLGSTRTIPSLAEHGTVFKPQDREQLLGQNRLLSKVRSTRLSDSTFHP